MEFRNEVKFCPDKKFQFYSKLGQNLFRMRTHQNTDTFEICAFFKGKIFDSSDFVAKSFINKGLNLVRMTSHMLFDEKLSGQS